MTKYLFLDTNVFLQCHSLDELPWGEVADDTEVVLLVPTVVEQELDQLKNKGNSRRARRARNASVLFRKASLGKNETLVIRSKGPRVTLTFPPPIHSTASVHPALAPDSPDDQIIAEALRCQEYGADRIVVSHDSRPLRSAKRVGLPHFVVPDKWLLPAEADERDKKIERLEAEVSGLRRTYPEIKLTIEGDGQVIDKGQKLAVEVMRIQPLDDMQIEALVEAQRKVHPLKDTYEIPIKDSEALDAIRTLSSMSQSVTRAFQPSQDQIKKYRDEDYPAYLSELRRFYQRLHAELERPSRHHKVLITLENSGHVPAEDLLLGIEARGGLLLRESFEAYMPAPPKPPNPPMSSMAEMVARFHISDPTLPDLGIDSIHRDPRAFYWEEGLNIGRRPRCSLICEEFRHKTSKRLNLWIHIPPGKEPEGRYAINVTVSARNLPEPIRETIGLRVTECSAEMTDVADTALLHPG